MTAQLKIKQLRKALRDLVAMNKRLDPTDEDRSEMKAAMRVLKTTRYATRLPFLPSQFAGNRARLHL